MDGIHDLGGMHGFGAVVTPGGEAPYHERWEPRAFALHILAGIEGLGAGPGGRATREQMDPAAYLEASYYQRWLWSNEQRLLRKGTIAPGEVEAMMERLAAGEPEPASQSGPDQAARAVASLREVVPLQPVERARFAPGQRVRVRRMRPAGHNPLPALRPRRARRHRALQGRGPAARPRRPRGRAGRARVRGRLPLRGAVGPWRGADLDGHARPVGELPRAGKRRGSGNPRGVPR
jgi:hypothetical protein